MNNLCVGGQTGNLQPGMNNVYVGGQTAQHE